MPVLTFIARVADGLLLVASLDSSRESQESSDVYRSQVILPKPTILWPSSPYLPEQAKQILKKLNPGSVAKCSIESRPYTFHYMIEQGICYLTLTDQGYPKRLAFLYLEEVHAAFVEELQRDHGNDWRTKVETVARPYAFIKFDKSIQRKRKEYLDPSSRNNMARLNDDLADIHSIMKKNIQEVLNRGERLDHVSQISKDLASQAEQFKWNSKKLSLMALWQQYAPLIVIGGVVLCTVYYKFFL